MPEPPFDSFEVLRVYMTTRAALTAADLEYVRRLFAPRRLKKGEVVQQAGEVPRYQVFVARGCLRSYVIDPRGNVHIVSFAPENWWLADTAHFLSGEPTTLFIDAIEASDVLVADQAGHQRMLDDIPALGAAYRVGVQRLAAARDKRIISSLTGSAEERYRDFGTRHPTLLQRVPQRMLASYLGMTPETLSRIRKKLASS